MCQIFIGQLFGKRDHKWRWLAIFRHKINSHSLKYWLNFIVWAIIFITFAFSQLSQQEKENHLLIYHTYIYLACRRRTCMWIIRKMSTWWNRHTIYRPAIGIAIDKKFVCVFRRTKPDSRFELPTERCSDMEFYIQKTSLIFHIRRYFHDKNTQYKFNSNQKENPLKA